MKYLLILLSLPLLAADAPKPVALPDAEQAKISKAQNAVLRLDSAMKQMQIQYTQTEAAMKAAQAELVAAIEAAKKAHGCASISEALECVPPAPKAEKKEK